MDKIERLQSTTNATQLMLLTEINNLKQQIENMKNFYNCKLSLLPTYVNIYCEHEKSMSRCPCDKWEMKYE